jgi:hypothetical protein
MLSAGFEPSITASEQSQNHAFDCAAAGIGLLLFYKIKFSVLHGTEEHPSVGSAGLQPFPQIPKPKFKQTDFV